MLSSSEGSNPVPRSQEQRSLLLPCSAPRQPMPAAGAAAPHTPPHNHRTPVRTESNLPVCAQSAATYAACTKQQGRRYAEISPVMLKPRYAYAVVVRCKIAAFRMKGLTALAHVACILHSANSVPHLGTPFPLTSSCVTAHRQATPPGEPPSAPWPCRTPTAPAARPAPPRHRPLHPAPYLAPLLPHRARCARTPQHPGWWTHP